MSWCHNKRLFALRRRESQSDQQSDKLYHSRDPHEVWFGYAGMQFASIPEYQGIGTKVGELFPPALLGQRIVDDAFKQAQEYTTSDVTEAGNIK